VSFIFQKYKCHINAFDRIEGIPTAGDEFGGQIPKANEGQSA
jgi:hypothetical protein